MRPVNLIPPEQRRYSNSPLRTGPLPYFLLGGLAALLVGVAVLVLASNQISERKEEVSTLTREDAAATKEAQGLSAYVQLAELRRQRTETIASLADSRFDWERVMRELAKILPSDVWLTSLNASASSQSSAGGTSSSSSSNGAGMRGSITGPALEISGCAVGQEGVAGFVTALKEIDGVTRVGVQSSGISPEGSSAEGGEGSAGGGSGGGNSDCRTRSFIAQFQMVIAFDAAPVPAGAEVGEEEAAAEPAPEESEESSSVTTSTTSGG